MHTLLLADDSITVQRVVALMFAAEDVRVVAASSGSEAVERISTDRPDVVLAATTLPGMTGYDLSRYVRDQKALKGVPVLLMSGAFEAVDQARLEASGAAGIVEKPIEPTTVISRVKELLGLKSDPPAPAPTAGRLVTHAGGPRDRNPGAPMRPAGAVPASGAAKAAAPDKGRAPAPPARSAPVLPPAPAPSTWDQLRRDTLEPDAKSVEASRQSGDVFDSLGDAFDSLDAQLSGRPGGGPKAGQARAPIAPAARGVSARDGGSPVYEVDDDWFGDAARGDDTRASERRELAAEMGIHELELPESERPATPVADLDFDFGIEATTTMAEETRRSITDDLRDIETLDLSPPQPSTAVVEMSAEIADLKTDLSAPAEPMAPAAPPAPPIARPDAPAAPTAAGPKVASRDAIAELLGAFPKPPAAPEKPATRPEPPVPPPAAAPPPAAINVKAPEPVPQTTAPPPAAALPRPAAAVPPPPVPETAPVSSAVPPPAPSRPPAPPVVIASGPPVADAFDALFAAEQGDPRGLSILAPAQSTQPELTGEMLDQVASKVAQQLGEGALGEQLRQALARSVSDTVREVVTATSERVIRDTVREVVATTAERVVRETVRDVVAETSERVARQVVPEAAERVTREVASEAAERVTREVASEAAERVTRQVASEASDRVTREVASETAERVTREVLPATSARLVREVVAETSERVVREAVTDAAERLVRQTVSDTSERLVRDEIARIRAQADADESAQD